MQRTEVDSAVAKAGRNADAQRRASKVDMEGIANVDTCIILKTNMVLHHSDAQPTMQRTKWHIGGNQVGGRSNVVAVRVFEPSPLLTVETEHIDALARARITRIDVCV